MEQNVRHPHTFRKGRINDDFNQPVITIKYINVRRINSTRERRGGKGGGEKVGLDR